MVTARLRRAVAGILVAACVACAGPDGAPRADADVYETLDVAALFDDQEGLMERAMRDVAADRPGIVDLYVLGFAGFADEDVFYNELRGALAVLDARFDTAGRSLLLVNRVETLAERPLASRNNLRAAVRRMAGRMNPDEDILFLLLTSHGGPDTIAVRHGSLPLGDLTAADVRGALDAYGIRWRVVVVSSCYSGSFIDDLMDERTLVLTAARQDRTSFGCANGRRFTEFGEAFFGDALWHEATFVAAFERAKRTIAGREAEMGLEPSEPQVSEGAAIAEKLEAFTRRLSAP